MKIQQTEEDKQVCKAASRDLRGRVPFFMGFGFFSCFLGVVVYTADIDVLGLFLLLVGIILLGSGLHTINSIRQNTRRLMKLRHPED